MFKYRQRKGFGKLRALAPVSATASPDAAGELASAAPYRRADMNPRSPWCSDPAQLERLSPN